MLVESATSAGAIILREIEGQLKIALAHWRQGARLWVLPKGHVEAGETLEQTALREIHEETGLAHVQLLTYLGSFVRERNKEGQTTRKTIHCYLAYALPSSEPEVPLETGFAEVGWFSPAEALELLPHEQEKAFIREHLGRLLE